MTTDYTALDAAILAAVAELQPAQFFNVSARVRSHSEPLAHTRHDGLAWRVVDRRLQHLRKAGRIRYQRKPEGWVMVEQGGGNG